MPGLVFLDVDGVLNTDMMTASHPSQLHPKLMGRLVVILDRSKANVVLSSTWRQSSSYMEILWKYLGEAAAASGVEDVKRVFIGSTPIHTPTENETRESTRVREIISYLEENPPLARTRVAVIDDLALSVIEEAGGESSAAKIKFFKVNPESGLSSRNVDDILEHLLSKC